MNLVIADKDNNREVFYHVRIDNWTSTGHPTHDAILTFLLVDKYETRVHLTPSIAQNLAEYLVHLLSHPFESGDPSTKVNTEFQFCREGETTPDVYLTLHPAERGIEFHLTCCSSEYVFEIPRAYIGLLAQGLLYVPALPLAQLAYAGVVPLKGQWRDNPGCVVMIPTVMENAVVDRCVSFKESLSIDSMDSEHLNREKAKTKEWLATFKDEDKDAERRWPPVKRELFLDAHSNENAECIVRSRLFLYATRERTPKAAVTIAERVGHDDLYTDMSLHELRIIRLSMENMLRTHRTDYEDDEEILHLKKDLLGEGSGEILDLALFSVAEMIKERGVRIEVESRNVMDDHYEFKLPYREIAAFIQFAYAAEYFCALDN